MRESIFPYEKWDSRRLASAVEGYQSARPFSHIVVDDFLRGGLARKLSEEFPATNSGPWIRWQHFNENKSGRNRIEEFPENFRRLVEELSSERFCAFLSELVGIPGLFADPHLIGGGIQQSLPGGFLNIHVDFTGHPIETRWQRRVNVIVYLNEDWQPEWNGQLELWDPEMNACVKKVAPELNRAVIFTLGEKSFHGHPERLACPEGRRRKSVALYYYTAQAEAAQARPTTYRARPQDTRLQKVFCRIDNAAVAVYSRLRQLLKFGDPAS